MNRGEYERQKERIDDFKSIQNRIDETDHVLEYMTHFNAIKFLSNSLAVDKTIYIADTMKDDLIKMLKKRKSHLQEQLEKI